MNLTIELTPQQFDAFRKGNSINITISLCHPVRTDSKP